MERKKSKIMIGFLLILSLMIFLPSQVALADTLADLGFSTSGEDLENHEERAGAQPYGSKDVTVNPVFELYATEIDTDTEGNGTQQRSLTGDNNLGDLMSGALSTNDKYVKTVAVDLDGEGKQYAIAELSYREANNGEIYLTVIDPTADLTQAASNEVLVYSNADGTGQLITDYRNEHTYLGLAASDFDNDGVGEIVVYVPDGDNPRLALYEIVDGQIENTPSQTFSFADQGYNLTKYVYMTCGDITGDNIDDLSVSYNVPDASLGNQSTGCVYIFKSQDFSLNEPHVFNHLSSGNGNDYFASHILNAAVAIGNVCGTPEDHHNELVVAGTHLDQSDNVVADYSALSYQYDSTTKTWDFQVVETKNLNASALYRVNPINENTLTALACIAYAGKNQMSYIYVNGVDLNTDDDVYETDSSYHYVDYGVVAGNFNGNSFGGEQLKILREKITYDNQTGQWVSDGFEIATYSYGGVYGSSSTLSLDSTATCGTIAAPNTDDDSIIMRYTGYTLQYSDPVILAVIASPPYFEDLEHLDGGDSYIGNSSTEFTTGEGSGTGGSCTNTVSAGAFITFEREFGIKGIGTIKGSAELEFTYNHTWETEYEDEVSTSITYGTFGGQDSVALYTIPLDVYSYDVWIPADNGLPGYWQTMQEYYPYPAAYTVIPLEQYDAIAERDGLLVVGDNILTNTLGKPETYPTSSDQMYRVLNPVQNDDFMEVGFGDAYTSQSIEINHSTTNTESYTCSISTKIGVGGSVGGTAIMGGVTAGYEGGQGTSTSSFENSGFTGTVVNMPLDAQDYGYGYQWKLVEYSYYDSPEDYFYEFITGEKKGFPVLNYAVKQVRRPPMLPANFRVAATTTDSITLQWKNMDPNATGYQLYRYYDFDNGLAGYYKVGDVLPAGTASFTDTGLTPYTSYQYKIQSIGTRYGGASSEAAMSILSPELDARTATDGEAPTIVTQPQAVTVSAGSVANFQVIVEPADTSALTERVFYTWHYDDDGTWANIADGDDATLRLLNVTKDVAGLYRCAVSQQVGGKAITVYSDTAELTVDKNTVELELQDGSSQTATAVAFNQEVTFTATFSNTQDVKPSGQVQFYITCYPDPTVDPDDNTTLVYQDPVVNVITTTLTSGTQVSVSWKPLTYGSYDVVAVYCGDDSYYRCVSNTESFACTAGADSDSALRISGLEDTLTYGDIVTIGATVAKSGAIRTLDPSEVTFSVTADDVANTGGLTAELIGGTVPQWRLTALKAGGYTLEADYGDLKVIKSVVVNRAEIAVAVVDQSREINTANDPFAIELTDGDLEFDDTLADTFSVSYECGAVTDSPSGDYMIHVSDITENEAENYNITAIQDGTLTVSGEQYNIKFHGVANGMVTALINNWSVKAQNYTTGYDINAGSTVRFTAIPDSGYRIEKWVVNGSEIFISGTDEYDTSTYITTASLSHDVNIEVYFVPATYTVTYQAGANGSLSAQVGSVSLGSGAVLPANTSVSFTATPADGYMVKQWKINGATVSGFAGTTYYYTVTSDISVEVTFALKELVAVKYQATGSGSVIAEDSVGAVVASGDTVVKGTSLTFTAVPDDENSMIEEWLVNGEVVQGNCPTYTIDDVQEAVDVEVVFTAAILYPVTFNAIGYGDSAISASVNGIAIESGDLVQGYSQVDFSADSPNGYIVKQWKLGSEVILGDDDLPWIETDYSLLRLQSSISVTVEFESVDKTLVSVTAPADVNGVANGTAKSAAGLCLPQYVTLVTDKGNVQASVTWDVANCSYDSADTAEQTFTVNGEVTLPTGVINPDAVDLNVAVNVTVNAASATDKTLVSVTVPADVSGVTNGSAKTAAGLCLPDTVTLVTDDGSVQAAVTWDVANSTYDADETDEQSFTVDGEATLPSGVINPNSVDLSITVDVTVNAAVDTDKTLASVITPNAITGVPFGSDKTATGLGLPEEVDLMTNSGIVSADVTWAVSACAYDPANGDEQIFTVDGDVTLPVGVKNPRNVSLSVSISVTVEAESESITYTITASSDSGGSISPSGTVSIAEGGSRTFTITPKTNYQIASVTVDEVDQGAVSSYIFTNVTANHTIAASFSYTGGSSGGGGGGASSSGTSTSYQAVISGSGSAGTNLPINVNTETGNAAVDLETLAASILSDEGTTIITVPTISGVTSYSINLPVTSLSGSQANDVITFATELGSITLPDNMLAGFDGDDAAIMIEAGDVSTLPADVQTAIGDRPLIQLTLILDGQQTEWNNPDAPVTVSIPYTPTANELADPEHIVVWYIDGSGNAVSVPNGRYDAATGTVIFTTTHFSYYTVAYVQKTFADLSKVEWAKNSIEVMASKGIINGSGKDTYSPSANITRADYLVLLVKTLGLNSGFDDNFDDIAPGTYYYEAVGIAKKLGIATGSADNRFNPTANITRQEMIVMTARALETYEGLNMTSDDAILDQFSDEGDIADYAVNSLATLVQEGLITGSEDKLTPRACTTRAEAAVFLYRIYNKYLG